MKKWTKDELIERLNKIHDNKFQYRLLHNNILTTHKIIVKCPIHGEFEQRISNHLSGQGCKKCVDQSKRNSFSIFLELANKTHGEKYSYTHCNFLGMTNKINILCKDHGLFSQTPHDHVNGRGCPKCFQQRHHDNSLEKAKLVFPHYDYSNCFREGAVIYNISCPKHGLFSALMSNHVKGHGCKKCAIEKQKMGRFNFIEIEEKLKEIFNNKYDYSLVENKTQNINTKSFIDIICPVHGHFRKCIQNHLYLKQGCPKCSCSGRYTNEFFSNNPDKKHIPAKLYLIRLDDEPNLYKIGVTKRPLKERLRNIQFTNLLTIDDTLFNVFCTEQYFLKNFLYRKRKPPTIKIGGDKECFTMCEDEIHNLIKEIYTFHNSLSDKSLD